MWLLSSDTIYWSCWDRYWFCWLQTTILGFLASCTIWAHANNKGADQPAHACSLISTFVLHKMWSWMTKLMPQTKFHVSRRLSDQTGLSLTWAQTLKTVFSQCCLYVFQLLTFYTVGDAFSTFDTPDYWCCYLLMRGSRKFCQSGSNFDVFFLFCFF